MSNAFDETVQQVLKQRMDAVEERVEKALPVDGFSQDKPVNKWILYSTYFLAGSAWIMESVTQFLGILPPDAQELARLALGILTGLALLVRVSLDYADNGKIDNSVK
jgi:hypothetical protein